MIGTCVPQVSRDVRARAERMVINSARDAAEAATLLEMLGLRPAPTQRHLRVVS